MSKVPVVHLIPTFNEAENIRRLLPSLSKLYKLHPKYKFRTLFVDDYSTDGTINIIQQCQKRDKSII